jgi:hypothetical protein
LRFLTNNGSLNEWMRITSGGSVGIGNTNPLAKLDVNGGINVSGSIIFGGTATKQVASGPEAISFQTLDGLQPPSAPALSYLTSGGSLAAGTYHVSITYVNANGETIQSAESSLTLGAANYQLIVTSPSAASAPAGNATGWNVYISTGATVNVKQNSSAIAIGTNWTQSLPPALTPIPDQVNLTNNTSGQRRVEYWGGLPSDVNAKALCDYQNWLEWGPGGSGALSDQDSGLRRRNDWNGIMQLSSNVGFQCVRGDMPYNVNPYMQVNLGAYGDGVLISDGTLPADGDTVTIGSLTYRFKSTMAQAYDVKLDSTVIATLTHLKAAINADGTVGTDYYSGTLANPSALVSAEWRNDTVWRYFHVFGTKINTTVAVSTTSAHLAWNGTALAKLQTMAGINTDALGGGSAGTGGTLYVTGHDATIAILSLESPAAGATILRSFVTNDTNNRIEIDASGKMSWGSGSAAPDTALQRTADPNSVVGLAITSGSVLGLPSLPTDPTTTGWGAPQAGRIWFNSTSSKIKFWDGGAIRTVTSA